MSLNDPFVSNTLLSKDFLGSIQPKIVQNFLAILTEANTEKIIFIENIIIILNHQSFKTVTVQHFIQNTH